MASILQDRSFRLSIILTFIFLGTGVAFLYLGLSEYGWVLFLLLPIVLGISIGALPSKKLALYGLALAAVIFLILLVIGQLEGFICVLFALPILLPLVFLGSVITHLIKRYGEIKSTERLNVLVLPLLLFVVAAPIEHYFSNNKNAVAEVRSEIILPYSANKVYDAIKSVDTLIAEKPFLMKLDLPVPQKCVLEKEEVGALRTCYFDGGTITERITALERGKTLKMDVIGYQLTGAKWLGFKEAIYLFDSLGENSCKMIRITTYTSSLRPRAYWTPLERLGIEQEHEYVFRSISNNLSKSAN